jgi:cytochrome c551/c552
MGPGMMGGHGPGMMGGQGGGESGPAAAGNPAWGRLNGYVASHRLPCMSCHAFTGRGMGPSFADIAHRFGDRPDGAATLAHAISQGSSGQWTGYPPMPGGQATPGEAGTLARLILELGK